MLIPIETILAMPLGKQLSDGGNWESVVVEIGNDWVYKEIKTEQQLDSTTPNLSERITLQRFWCSDTHFANAQQDYRVLTEALEEWILDTYILRSPARFSDNPNAIVFVQPKVSGQLLSARPDFKSETLANLTAA